MEENRKAKLVSLLNNRAMEEGKRNKGKRTLSVWVSIEFLCNLRKGVVLFVFCVAQFLSV